MNVTIFTDGSCINNGKPEASAGWSVIIEGDVNEELYGKLPGNTQTNNRAELFAVQKALEWIKDHPDVEVSAICSDSKLAIDGMIGRSSRKANRDIWEKIEELAKDIGHQVVDVRHISREENKRADELAKVAANALFCIN